MSAYLHYIIKNLEPLRISDDATSQRGQTNTLKYIPGSAVRGMVVNHFAQRADFESLKPELFTKPVIYFNACLTTKEHDLMPSPKGFYEDKTIVEGEKEIQNVVIDGTFSDGMKRASLGSCCYVEDGCIHYYSVKTSSDMKVLVNPEKGQKRNVFRLETIAAGQYFEGYIHLSGNTDIDDGIRQLFRAGNTFSLGNARSAGLGRCEVVESGDSDRLSVWPEAVDAEGECYMMLLSDTVMRDGHGEYCGLSLEDLEELMQVSQLEIAYASTSTRSVHGFNRAWGIKLPSVPVYEAGSVFHLTYEGVFSADRMEALYQSGLGVRKNEGFGQVVFLPGYESVHKKKPETWCWTDQPEKPKAGNQDVDMQINPESAGLSSSEEETLKTVARRYYRNQLDRAMQHYIIDHPLKKGKVAQNQIGQIEAYLLEYRYKPDKAYERIRGFLKHARKKEQNLNKQKERPSISSIERQITGIFDTPLEELLSSGEAKGHGLHFHKKGYVMGVPVDDIFSKGDEDRYKLQLIIQMIRYDRRKEDNDTNDY